LSTAVPLVAVAALSLTMAGGGDKPSDVQAAEPVKLAAAASQPAVEVRSETKTARPAESEPAAENELAGNAELRLSPLDRADPRWAAAPETSVPDASRSPVAEALREHAENAEAAKGDEPRLPLDRSTTAAIGRDVGPTSAGADVPPAGIGASAAAVPAVERDATTVAVAETPAEVAALEAAAADAAAAHSEPAFEAAGANMLDAHANEWVNFRDAPTDDSNVIRVVAYEEAFKAQPVEECVHFCAVVVDGQSGYIHKDFINYEGSQPAESAEPAETVAAASAAPTAAAGTVPATAAGAPQAADAAGTPPAAEPEATGAR
jgi:hypothetical protein